MKFMEKVETTEGDGLAIGFLKGGGICVSLREGDKGPGQNRLFGWCELHRLAYPYKEVCPRCYPVGRERVIDD